MKTITQLREEIDSKYAALTDMKERCKNENRQPTSAERGTAESIMDELELLEEEHRFAERMQKTDDRVNKGTRRAEEKPSPGKDRAEQERRDSFSSLGEQLMAVIRSSGDGARVDQRLSRAASGLQEMVPSDGGFLVQTDFASGLLNNVWKESGLLSRVKKYTVSGSSNSMTFNGIDETSRVDGSRAGGVQGFWKGEAAAFTASDPTFREIELKLNTLTCLCYLTDELMQDASALEGYVSSEFKKEMEFKLADGIINGTGVGQPLGIMVGGSMINQTAETGQAAATVVYENIVKMWSRLYATSRQNAVWYISQDIEPQLHTMSLTIGTGGVPVYMPAGGASGSPYGTLYGRPVVPIEQCQTLGTSGDIILADLTGGYIAIEKGGMKKDVSIHVRFLYGESCLRMTYRFDGQPITNSATTPFNSGSTQSYFVKLATRS